MHYVPESAREFFQEQARTPKSDDAALADVASLYVLTVVVGLLLAADAALGVMNLPGTEWYRTPFGYRLALFAAVIGGARILYHSLDNLLAGRVGADLALTTACLAAIALGEHQTAGLVVFISLVGEAVEGFTLQQAKRAIRRTFELRPQTAQLIRDGLERDIAVAELQPGDRVLVRAGDRIPADGRIVSGSSAINESPFTGESLPVDKTVDDPVLTGSINLTAALTIVVERTGENTSLAEMERLVRQATSRKMHCERTADRFARWFLPVVLAVAAVTLLAWRWQTGTWQAGWLPALGVLVVACPCPLILATPCAVMASLAWLARRGIVVKGSAALERLAAVDAFAFDKTGTLSAGDLSLGTIVPLAGISADELLQLAASAERPSGHPIARVLRKSATDRKLPLFWPEEFAGHIGAGVTARIVSEHGPSRQIVIGSQRLLADYGIQISDELRRALEPRIDQSPRPRVGGEGQGEGASDHGPGTGAGTDRKNREEFARFSDSIPPLPNPLPRGGGEGTKPDAETRVEINAGREGGSAPGDLPRPVAHSFVTTPSAITHLLRAGQTPLLVAVDGQLAGLIGLRESLRDESATVLRELKQLGIRQLTLLTGDRPGPAESAARTLAVFDHVAAEQLPADKARWIEAARTSGQRVAMIGDGVNDGPALAAADVGLAVCRAGSELAGEAGDILLLGDPLRPLPGLIRLSRALVENIRQSIHWFALGVNGLGMLACSVGWLSPVMAAVLHETASLLVMLNALRLLWFQDRPAARHTASPKWIDALDQWAARLSPGRFFAGAIHRWRLTLQLVGCGLVAGWLCSQVVMVRDDEKVVVLRGGKYHTTLSAGWSWRWPWPLERLIRVRPDAVQAVTVGFRGQDKGHANPLGDRAGDLEWTSSHDDASFRGAPDESLYLTGDEVAVELTAEVQYRIADVPRFALAGSLQPEETIRSAAEAVLRAAVAADSLDNVLTEHRAGIERGCLDELRRRIGEYDLGVEILAVNWLDVHPPKPVVAAYRQVSDAWEQREQAVNEARTLATRTLYGTAGETAIRRLQRELGKEPQQELADWSLTAEAWKSLSTPNEGGERVLSGAAGAVLLEAEAAAERQRFAARGQADRLRDLLSAAQSHPELSHQHFYWTAVIEALAGKPFTLVDPALSGRRQFYLGDVPTNAITLPMPPEK